MTAHSTPSSEPEASARTYTDSSTPEDFAALREIEIEWLMEALSDSIANLGYPVGCGVPPSHEHLKFAATRLFERYAKMIEMARNAGAPAQGSPNEVAERLINEHFAMAHTDMVGDEEFRAGYVKGIRALASALSSTERK